MFRTGVVVAGVALTLAACGRGVDPEELRRTAENVGTSSLPRSGGYWSGMAEPPDVWSGGSTVRSGSGRTVRWVDRSGAFPTISDSRPPYKRWRERSSVNLDLIDQVVAGSATWSILRTGGEWSVERTAEGSTQAVPVPQLEQIAALAASEDDLVILDQAGALVGILDRGELEVAEAATALTKVCSSERVGGSVMFTGSSGSGPGCDQVYRFSGGSPELIADGVAGAGFVDGLVLTLEPKDPSCVDTCTMAADLRTADGEVLRSLPELPWSPRTGIVVGAVRDVPVVFSGASTRTVEERAGSVRIDDVFYEVDTPGVASRVHADGMVLEEGAWTPIKPFPTAHPRISEPLHVHLGSSQMVVVSQNAIGTWAPSGSGSSWRMEDLYVNPLYVATEQSCLNLRSRPSLRASVIACMDRGVEFWSDGGHFDSDQERWVSVLLPGRGLRGWVAERYLSGVSPDEPAEFYCGAP